jgi:hypothetical protein
VLGDGMGQIPPKVSTIKPDYNSDLKALIAQIFLQRPSKVYT